ncbi:MAG TPA: hypothetical protein VN752_04480 [Solirubrobacterales bacterium]|nr:hypothetical protein [Solirubrobacterales bacterium]
MQLLLGLLDPLERGDSRAPHGDQGRLALLHGGASRGKRLLFGGDRVACGLDLVFDGAQPGDGALDLIAQVANPGDDGFVHPTNVVDVFGAIDQIVVAIGADDDAEHVGGAGLIDRDQALAQGDERPFQPRPHHGKVPLCGVELGDCVVELGLLGAEANLDRSLTAAQHGHLRGQPLDPLAITGNGRRQHALALAHLGELRFLGVELRFEIVGGGDRAGSEQHDQRRRGGKKSRQGRASLEHRQSG